MSHTCQKIYLRDTIGGWVPRGRHRPLGWGYGFTLVELLTSIAVMIIMLMLINRLFRETTDAVNMGAGNSDLIAHSRAVSEQLTRDMRELLGPRPSGGFLVIVNKQIDGVEIAVPRGGEIKRSVRSDQIAFLRPRGNLDPLTPGNNTSYANSSNGGFAKVWYGHGQRTKEDGSDLKELGQEEPTFPNNAQAHNWILCRQAIILDPDFNAGDSEFVVNITGVPYYDAAVQSVAVSSKGQAYFAVSDVARCSLADITGPASILGNPSTAVAQYQAEAMRFTYAYPGKRLRVNPTPAYPYDSWRVAQTHAFLAAHVSDFIVEFAADANNDGVIDFDPSTNAIMWYDSYNSPPYSGFDRASPYYSSMNAFVFQHNDDGSYYRIPTNMTASPELQQARKRASQWPHMLRFRWRMHDANGQLGMRGLDGNVEGGKWYELVVKVNRPR